MDGALDITVAAGAATLALACVAALARERARALRARIAARIAERTKAALLNAARDMIAASRASPLAVARALDEAIRASVRGVDAVALLERRPDHLLCTYASGGRLEHFRGRAFSLDDPAAHARAARGGSRIVARPPEPVLHPSDRISLAVPLADGERVLAVLAVGSVIELPAGIVDLIVALASQAAPALALALERTEDRRRATIDGLTGLLTPRAFRTQLRAALERARRDPRARAALLFVDTDHFKAWNDAYGHASGDAVLCRIADLLRAHAGPNALCARNGGDEFCLLFEGMEKSAAIVRAQALREAIAGTPWEAQRPRGESPGVAITASIGLAAFPADAANAEDLLERADAAMYHSKRGGRNRVSHYVDGALVSSSSEERCDGRASPG